MARKHKTALVVSASNSYFTGLSALSLNVILSAIYFFSASVFFYTSRL